MIYRIECSDGLHLFSKDCPSFTKWSAVDAVIPVRGQSPAHMLAEGEGSAWHLNPLHIRRVLEVEEGLA